MERADIIARLTAGRAQLEGMGVRRLFLFGSFAEERASGDSDVDVMVDLDEGPEGRKPMFSAFDVGGIRHELAALLDRKVDLVVRSDALRPDSKLRNAAESRLVDVF